MFENANPNNPGQPAGNPMNPAGAKGVEDIFSQMDGGGKPPRPAVLEPRAAGAGAPENELAGHAEIKKSMDTKRLLLAGLGLGGLILIFIGVWYSYNIFLPKREEAKEDINSGEIIPAVDQTQAQTAETTGDDTAAETEATEDEDLLGTDILLDQSLIGGEETGSETKPPTADSSLDSDNDGITDQEETSLGTDPKKMDSDDDGLFDKEEVNIYKTDPINADTDGDTFSDGSEVKNGYNPKGSGKLYEVMP